MCALLDRPTKVASSDSDWICILPLQTIRQGDKRDVLQPTWLVFSQQAKHSKLVGRIGLEEVLTGDSADTMMRFDTCRDFQRGRRAGRLVAVPWWWCSSLKISTFSPHCLSGASGLEPNQVANTSSMRRKAPEKTTASKLTRKTHQNGESSWPTAGTGGRLRSERSRSRGEEKPGRYLRSGCPAASRISS